jgi:multidrug efflux pump subunit AcrA (membrane-fusion protein)
MPLPRAAILVLSCLAIGCLDEDEKGKAKVEPKVPVTTLTLELTEPGQRNQRMGIAQPYREESIGFEVAGRLASVLDVGRELTGPVLGPKNEVVHKGEVIARIDPTRYQQQVESHKLRLAAEKAELEAQRIDLNGVARAQANLALVTFKRQAAMFREGAAKREALDRARADNDVAQATLKLKQAQILSKQARISELAEGLRIAQLDLSDCVLRAPFSGRITQQHLSRGAYVQAGSKVVTLTLLDPIKVVVAVSAADDRQIALGGYAKVFPAVDGLKGVPPFLEGRVKAKGQVADPATRTFPVEVMTRNLRHVISGAKADFERVVPLLNRYHLEGGALYTPVDALLSEGGKTYLLLLTRDQVLSGKGPQTPRKVEVTPGKGYWTILDWNMREVAGEGLRLNDFALRSAADSAGKPVAIDRRQWLLRPGDMVPVNFDLGNLPRGIYVPIQAIRELNGETSIYVVEDGKAKRIKVEAHETFVETRRITGEGLAVGQTLVVDGVHYLAEGMSVVAESLKP